MSDLPQETSTWGTALIACGQQVLSTSSLGSPFLKGSEIEGSLIKTPAAAAIAYLPVLLRYQRSPLEVVLSGNSIRQETEASMVLQDQSLTIAWYAHQLVLGWIQIVAQNAVPLSPKERLEALQHHLKQSVKSVNRTSHPEVKFSLEPLLAALDDLKCLLDQPQLIMANKTGTALSLPLLSPLIWALYFSLTAVENYPVAVIRALRLRHSPPLVVSLTGLFSGIVASSIGLPPVWLAPILAKPKTPLVTQEEFPSSKALRQLPDQLYAACIGIDWAYAPTSLTADWPTALPIVHS
ncbi:MAG: hypothetical protein AAFW84_01740 [Cyanobacteria bacterium J06635_15]